MVLSYAKDKILVSIGVMRKKRSMEYREAVVLIINSNINQNLFTMSNSKTAITPSTHVIHIRILSPVFLGKDL